MKKFFVIMMFALAGITMAGCEYDDQPLWSELEQIKDRIKTLEEAVQNANSNVKAVQTIVSALEKKVYVTAVTETANGYLIKFSDGKTAEISNGKDGVDAPVISARADEDGKYYWTLGGEWMLVEGNKICAAGEDGTAPKVRINNETKEWEVSYDNEKTWTSTGVVAEGKDGEDAEGGLEVDLSNDSYVVVTMKDGSSFKLDRYDESAPVFTIKDMPQVAQVEYGKSVSFEVEAKNVAEYIISVPQCWRAVYANDTLTVTAPEKDLCHYEKEGVLAVTAVSASGKVAITKLDVYAGEWVEGVVLRTLTFEDEDTKFEPYECEVNYPMMGYSDYITVEKWSDYIPRDGQYGNGHGSYEWYDEGNTELAFVKPEIDSWWGISGHAGISDYVGTDEDINSFGDDNMLFMIDLQAYNVKGGANGSKNFCSQYGYLDPDQYATQYSPEGVLPGLQFYDEVPRVIDHMYVTNTTYAYGIITRGECDFGGSYEYTDESTFKVVAYGYDSLDDTEPTIAEFYLLNTGKRIVTDWTKWDLTSLGAVVRVEFNLIACYEGYGRYGLVIPAYFAYDDIAVQFPGQIFK